MCQGDARPVHHLSKVIRTQHAQARGSHDAPSGAAQGMGSIAAARVAETASTATAADETDTAHTITSALLDGEGIA